MESISTDILVIGGGGAGSRAALSAKTLDTGFNTPGLNTPGLNVTLATTGKYGYSGSTTFFASETLGINAPLNMEQEGDSPEIYRDDIIDTGLGLADKDLCKIISKEASLRINDLIDLGIEFDSYNGRIKQRRLSGCTKARSLSVNGRTGFCIVEVLKNANLRNGVNVIESCTLIDLIVDENKVSGGLFAVDTGLLLIEAKAVILACGGAGRLFQLNVNPPDIKGTGYAAALRAGAQITNLEFIQIGPGVVHPDKKFIIHSYMWSFLPRLLNAEKEEFLSEYLPENLTNADVLNTKRFSFPFSCRTDAKYFDIAVFKEIEKGNAAENGGILLDLSHVPFNELNQKASVTYNFFKKTGFDIHKEMLEIAPMVQSFNGGVLINENGETSVSGLFAAGETSGGVHGADRPGGDNLISCQVFGHRAGISASCFAREKSSKSKSGKSINSRIEKDMIPEDNSGSGLLNRLKSMFSRHLSIVRNKHGLNSVVNFTNDILQNAAERQISRVSPVYNAALIGNAVAKSALLREESRGTHYREDYSATSSAMTKRIILEYKDNEIIAEFEKEKSETV